jgi:hypothetical protein
MASREPDRVTVGQIRRSLQHLPDDMPVEFAPITMAWLGTSGKMRFGAELNFYTKDGDAAKPYDPGAYCHVYLFEEPEKEFEDE